VAEPQLTQTVDHEVQVSEAQGLAGQETINGCWPIDVGELKAFEVDATTGGHAKSM